MGATPDNRHCCGDRFRRRCPRHGDAVAAADSNARSWHASLPEAPFDLRIFTGAVKTDSRGEIIDGADTDPVKKLVGAEAAGPRAGMERFTKIMFGVGYFDGRPDKGSRIDPNNPQLSSGSQHWPFVKQPFRSWPNSVAVTPDGRKLYVDAAGPRGLS